MSKKLTFGEATQILRDLRAELGRDPELLECIARGYECGLERAHTTTPKDLTDAGIEEPIATAMANMFNGNFEGVK